MQVPTQRQLPATPVPHAVKTAVDLMRARLGEPLTVSAIAGHCGVAERTLNEQFRRFLQVSPGRYLRKLRLAAAREHLLRGAESGMGVTDVAQCCGFRHYGRFARLYRADYGETPSATLRRSRRRGGSPQESAPTQTRSVRRRRPSLAVVPLRHPREAPGLATVATAVAEDLATALCEIRSLDTRLMRTSHMDRMRCESPVTDYLLTGSIAESGPGRRIALQLVEVATGNLVWGETVSRRASRLVPLGAQAIERLCQAVVNRILRAEIDRAVRLPRRDLGTYGLGMRALDLTFRSRPDATRRALDLLHPAIERDPDNALTTALAAWAHAQLVMYSDSASPAQDRASAMAFNRRAALLDEHEPLVLTARSAVHTMAGEFDDAEALITRALKMNPVSGWAWGRSAWLRAYAGDYRRAIAHFERALRMPAPHGVRANALVGLGTAHFGQGDYTAAARWLQMALRENPGMWWANRSLSVSLARIGERKRACKALAKLRLHRPGLTVEAVVASVPFDERFLNRLGEGLDELGMPP